MVAELLRLKLRVLANGFRKARGAFIRIVGGGIALALAIGLASGLVTLATTSEWKFLAVVGPIGALLLVACLLVPMIMARDEPLHARGFVGYGVGPTQLSLVLPLTDLLSLPALLLGIVLIGVVTAWSALGAGAVAVAAAALLLVIGLQLVRLGATFGAWLARHPYGDLVRSIAGALLLVAALVILIPVVRDPRYAYVSLIPVSRWIDVTPLGMLWAAPGISGAAARLLPILTGAIAVVLLWIVWRVVVGREFAGSRERERRVTGGRLGWLRVFPATPSGAIAARSLSYWLRDPRYAASFILLPFVPVLMLIAAATGGIPLQLIVLVPLPIVVSVLAWATTHNDVALDSTAVWTHLVSQTRGIDDRVGRAVPPLLFGTAAIAIGAPLTAWGFGDWRIIPAVIGVAGAVLLASVGIASAVSVRFPYAAPPPGSGLFTAPQSVSGSGAVPQALTFVAGLAAAAPAAVLGWMSFDRSVGWSWGALGAGLGVGVVVLILGVLVGARYFERRGPELLAFAMRN